MTAEEVIAAARVHVAKRTPFVSKGRSDFGVDCIGIMVVSFAAAGIILPGDRADYSNQARGDGAHKDLLEKRLEGVFGKPVPRASMRAGDVVSMAWAKLPHHVGLIADHPEGGLSLIDCNNSTNFVCERRLEPHILRMICNVYRYPF